MKDYMLDTSNYKKENQDQKCTDSIRGRMAENLKRVRAEIEANKKKPRSKVVKMRK